APVRREQYDDVRHRRRPLQRESSITAYPFVFVQADMPLVTLRPCLLDPVHARIYAHARVRGKTPKCFTSVVKTGDSAVTCVARSARTSPRRSKNARGDR